MKCNNKNNNRATNIEIYSSNSIKPITYIHIAIRKLFNERRLDSHLAKIIKQKNIKSKKHGDIYSNELYEAIFTTTSDLYIKKNYWNERADYDKFDNSIQSAIRIAVYRIAGIKPKSDKEEKIISKLMSEIEDQPEELYL